MAGDKPILRKVKLSECATFQEGYVNPSQTVASYFGSDVKWLRAVDLNDSFVSETSRRLSFEGYHSAGKAAQLFEPDSLAISKSGTIGRLGILKDYMCGNRAVINIRVDLDRYDSRFIFYSLLLRRNLIEELAAGSVQRNLYCSVLGDLEIEVPPLPEQKAIASILGALDDKIELNRRMNATLEAIARALFQSWFVDFDPVRAKLDGRQPAGLDPATASLFPASFQDSPLGPIPTGWKVERWGDIATLEYGKSLRDYRTGRGKYRVYGTNGPIGFHNEFLSEKPGIVIGRKGAYRGVHYSAEPFYVIDTAFYLRPSQPLDVLWAYFELLQFDINGMDSGSAIPSTSRDDFYGIPVVHPPLDIQRKFGSLAAEWFQKVKLNSEENDSLSKVRDLLLPQLISGSVEAKNALA